MIKRALCFVVLTAMIVHCAGRIGVLSYLYQKRHEIAFATGIIADVPISICSHEYDSGRGLAAVLGHADPDNGQQMPCLAHAEEINLFVVTPGIMTLSPGDTGVPLYPAPVDRYDLIPGSPIFHPPLFV